MEATKAAVTSISTRPFLRGKAVIALAAVATATAVAFKYKAAALNQNDVEQRTRKAPYGYVSVDRSGGGI
ncbi:Peptide synthetase [Fusarium albosuccineum]|uniref:Peptide synthetase n=1 Tax=Fusarium albosuccineum TaxID=1237068 RepID=A0A8H4LHN0_9HYPO|nr:Peptide synthetase [Fusarium albosuccineum]